MLQRADNSEKRYNAKVLFSKTTFFLNNFDYTSSVIVYTL